MENKVEDVDKIIPNVSGLMTAAILDRKIGKVKNKIPDVSGLVTTTVLNRNIREVEKKILDHAKGITTPEFNKFAGIFDERLKQANLVPNKDPNTVTKFNKIENV